MSTANSSHPVRRLVAYALLTALGVVFSRVFAIDAGALRFHLGAVPVLLAGIVFGPAAGAAVGAAADIIGGLLVGYSINPVITLGAAAVGWVCGMLYRYLPAKSMRVRAAAGIFGGHIVGSIVINSLALRWFFGYAWAALAPRIPTYLVLSAIETAVLWAFTANPALMDAIRGEAAAPKKGGPHA